MVVGIAVKGGSKSSLVTSVSGAVGNSSGERISGSSLEIFSGYPPL